MIPSLVKRFLSAFAMVCGLVSVTSAAEKRPNILLFLPDQMRAEAMGCMGNPDVKTPNLDRMAKEGMLFRRTHANTPVCCPARAILFTGTYPHVNGMIANDLRLRESEVTIAEILRDAGYRTGFIGKWHLDGGPRLPGFVPPGPRRQGFDYWAAYECSHTHFTPYYFRDTPDVIMVQKFEPEASTDFAVEFLKTQSKEKPFFLTLQLGPPHDPYGAPTEYTKQYDPAKLTMRKNWQPDSETSKGGPGIPPKLRYPGLPEKPYAPAGGREEVAAYYAAITAIDDQVGRILKTLKETGQDENTIILFTSDHGDMLGSHGMRRKRKPHEESANVPGIFRWPGKVPAGKVVDTLFSHVDMPVTLLNLVGLPVPKNMQGDDLSQVTLGHTTKGPEAVFQQIFVPYAPDQIAKPWRGVITDRYTYARYEDGPWVLFDNQKDPYQMTNLATDAKSADLIKSLDQKVVALMKKNGDAWSFNSNELVEEGGRLYKTQAFYTLEEFFKWDKANPQKTK